MGVKSSSGNSSLSAAKQTLLNLLHENADRYSTDNINSMQNLLTAKKLAVDNRLRSYLKKYNNQIGIDFLDTLAVLSVNLLKEEKVYQQPKPVMWYGYHSQE